ncbi:MAG: response regulator transcription factor [Actinomycetes bacterium]
MTAVVERVGARTVARQPGRSTALVAVQHPAARETAVRLLRALGASDVVAAGTVAEARRAVVPRNADVAVVEATLPDGSGIGLVGDLKTAGWRRTVVVATSADPYTVRAAVRGGVRCLLLIDSAPRTAPGPSVPESVRGLSQREIEVLQLVADGHSNAAVGNALGLSGLTVKSHLARIARKLGTGDRAEMVVIALRAGVIR